MEDAKKMADVILVVAGVKAGSDKKSTLFFKFTNISHNCNNFNLVIRNN